MATNLDPWLAGTTQTEGRYAFNQWVCDGSHVNFGINFQGVAPGYLSRSDVYYYTTDDDTLVSTDPVMVPANAWQSDTVIQLKGTDGNPLPVGQTLSIYRDTPKNQPLVDFTDGSVIDEENLDTVTEQAIYGVAEMVDRFNVTSDVASGAVDKANQAIDSASSANTTAANAVAIANAASTTAAGAVATADAANTTAGDAAADAETAVETANAAAATANGIDGKATQALSNSETAVETANEALSSTQKFIFHGRVNAVGTLTLADCDGAALYLNSGTVNTFDHTTLAAGHAMLLTNTSGINVTMQAPVGQTFWVNGGGGSLVNSFVLKANQWAIAVGTGTSQMDIVAGSPRDGLEARITTLETEYGDFTTNVTISKTGAEVILNDTSGNTGTAILMQRNGQNDWGFNVTSAGDLYLRRYVGGSYVGDAWAIRNSDGLYFANSVIRSVQTPSDPTDATTKAYVDALVATAVAPPQAQCQFYAASATAATLVPFAGDLLNINGTNRVIPSAGVSLANTGLAANTRYFVYAYMSGSTMTLEASTTTPGAAVNGIIPKTGDATRSLVGMLLTNASSQFVDGTSWYNRIKRTFLLTVNNATASSSPVGLSNLISVLTWQGEPVQVNACGIATLNGQGEIRWADYADGVQGAVMGASAYTSGANVPLSISRSYSLALGNHNFGVSGWTDGAHTGTYQFTFTVVVG